VGSVFNDEHFEQRATKIGGDQKKLVRSSETVIGLHWLPIESRIEFKIACITYKTFSAAQPAYLLHSV